VDIRYGRIGEIKRKKRELESEREREREKRERSRERCRRYVDVPNRKIPEI